MAICLILGGCVTSRRSNGTVFGAVDDVAAVDPAFRPGMEFLSGFDLPQAGDLWQPDDWTLLGIKVSHGDKRDVWFVRLSTLPPRTGPHGEALPQHPREYVAPFAMGSVKAHTKSRLSSWRRPAWRRGR